ncbi:OLC1v1007509C1 [Oldenlandia corymbosa var. corymbosa]|uniref:OLC1v1007509C1 n=1 Tax=Oldenlandia corymbosa var. corymbosa TaxID=529605 RepID=A0AAV1DJG9_OLDCO|nr:OLC1v1007509C1 [Oldenlandia corymbosa var. corymbosa]
MVATLITSILSVIDDVEYRLKVSTFRISDHETLIFKLRNLKLFVLSAKSLGNDTNLKSFLEKIKDTVLRNAKLIQWRSFRVFSLTYDIDALEDEIDKWYATLLDINPPSNSLTTDDVLEIISSFLKNVDPFIQNFKHELKEAMEVLVEHMTFLSSLILFATHRNSELREDLSLWAHAATAAVSAAYLLTPGAYKFHGGKYKEESGIKISTVVQKIKPIDPQVISAYTKALSSSKSATCLHAPTNQGVDDEALLATQNLLHSLICVLWDELRVNTRVVVHVKDQGQELYEGLRYLRKTLLRQQKLPNHFNMKVREDSFDVVCDAGILYCSLYQTDMETDTGLQDVLAAIKYIQAELEEEESLVTAFNFCSTTQLEFVDILLGQLTEQISCESETTPKIRTQIIRDELVSFRYFLGDIVELRHEREELQILWDRILEVAYGVEYLIDYLVVDDPPYSFSTAFDLIMKDINKIKPQIKAKDQEAQVNQINKTQISVSSKRSTPLKTKDIVGFHDETQKILRRLTRGSKELRIVAIVGMPGLGKTTLAERVYNDPSVSYHFSARAWITVSQTMDRTKVLLNLLAQVAPDRNSEITSKMTADDVAQELWRSLKKRPYLIVLDDIWDDEAWESFQNTFPNDFVGSRIMLTSRRHNIARRGLPDEEPHELRPLNQEESLDLLQRELFCGNGWPSGLVGLDLKIAEICNGLPLTIVVVAGFLKSTSPEEQRSIGGTKACRIHDLVHEFCFQKSKEEHFLHFLEGDDELPTFREPCRQWRLCIRSRHRHLRKSKIFCPRARSLLFNFDRYGVKGDISFMMHICKLLKVLDLEQTRLDGGVPSEIGLLVRLTFIAINCPVDSIPPSVSNLYNLETFILKSVMSNQRLPYSLWNLRKLKYLHIHGTNYNCYAILPMENLDESCQFYELERLSGLAVPDLSSMVKLMKKFPNIRQLKFELMSFGDGIVNVVNVVVPEFLQQLESLHISQGFRVPQGTLIEFNLPENLKKLTLRRFDVSGRSLSTIGELPSLEVLKLQEVVFEGRRWSMEEEEFSKLKFLKLSSWNLRWWSGSDDQFGSLENLVLSDCPHLEEIPDCFENSSTLQMIKVRGCIEAVKESVTKIWEAQKDWGNSDPKIIVNQ